MSRKCAAVAVLEMNAARNPEIRMRQTTMRRAVEASTPDMAEERNIPVVVHVLYNDPRDNSSRSRRASRIAPDPCATARPLVQRSELRLPAREGQPPGGAALPRTSPQVPLGVAARRPPVHPIRGTGGVKRNWVFVGGDIG